MNKECPDQAMQTRQLGTKVSTDYTSKVRADMSDNSKNNTSGYCNPNAMNDYSMMNISHLS